MAKIAFADPSVWDQAKKPTKGYGERDELRKALADLETEDQVLEITPEEGETLRKLKVMTKWAAKEVGREIRYAETLTGSLAVRLERQRTPGEARRGRPPRVSE
jgi:hypothetical protein